MGEAWPYGQGPQAERGDTAGLPAEQSGWGRRDIAWETLKGPRGTSIMTKRPFTGHLLASSSLRLPWALIWRLPWAQGPTLCALPHPLYPRGALWDVHLPV